MSAEHKRQWKTDPNAEYLTQGVHEFSIGNIALMFKKMSIVDKMGQPATDEQKIAFEIIADCILAEEEGGSELRTKVLGIEVGRLERNAQYWTRYVPEEKRWEPKVIAELKGEIERAHSSVFADTYEEARTNVLYGTWRKSDMLGFYIDLINNHPWEKVEPILHGWYEKFIIEDAVDITPHNHELTAK